MCFTIKTTNKEFEKNLKDEAVFLFNSVFCPYCTKTFAAEK